MNVMHTNTKTTEKTTKAHIRILISSGVRRIWEVFLENRSDQILGAILCELTNWPLAFRSRKLAWDLTLVSCSVIATKQTKSACEQNGYSF